MPCFSPAAILALAAGELDAQAREAAERHLDECFECREVLAIAAAEGVIPGVHDELRRYVISHPLGAGAMGTVYAARDSVLHREVALKIIPAPTPASRRRFLREARALARITHPHVVAVHDAGIAADTVYISMELIDGTDLQSWLAAAPRTWQEIVEVYRQAGRGLAVAHAAGLIHRDVKPHNILIDARGRARVTDFGLVSFDVDRAERPASEGDAPSSISRTQPDTLLGTPAYMAPEQLAGLPATRASDQFGFCVALYEALVGRRPFEARGIDELRSRMLHAAPPRVPRTAAPRRIRRAIERGLARERADRFRSMEDLVAALAPRSRLRALPWLGAAAVVAAIALVWATSAPARDRSCMGRRAQQDDALATIAVIDGFTRRAVAAVERRHRDADRCDGPSPIEPWNFPDAIFDAALARIEVLIERREFLPARAAARALVERIRPLGAGLALAHALHLLGRADAMIGELAEAEGVLREAVEVADRERADHSRAEALVDLMLVIGYQPGRNEEGARLEQLAAGAVERAGAPRVGIDFESRAGEVRQHRGQYAAALAHYERAYELAATRAVEDPGSLIVALHRLGNGHLLTGEVGRAESELQYARVLASRALPPTAFEHGAIQLGLGELRVRTGRAAEALPWVERALTLLESAGVPHNYATYDARRLLAACLVELGRPAEARQVLAPFVAQQRQRDPEGAGIAVALTDLADVDRAQGRIDEAIAGYRQAITVLEKRYGADEVRIALPLIGLGLALHARGRPEARRHLERAVELFDRGEVAAVETAQVRAILTELRRRPAHSEQRTGLEQ